jgi:AraC-like DNA-binding protein
MMFHVVTAGQCWLEVEGANSCHLRPGDLALVPHGEGHRLVGAAGVTAVKLFDSPRELVSDRYEILRHGGGGESTTVICGVVRWIQSTLRFMAAEARELRPGGETVITRLADILVIQAIRSWIARDPAAQTGWLGALRDQQIGRAIALVHRDPARNWTVASLAMAVGMSRSAFAARFSQLVGEPAVRYVTRWKMHAALMWLKEENAALSEIASRLGYESEAAFSRAFKRFVGISPGAARRREPRALHNAAVLPKR